MGTRLLLTREAPIHDKLKEALLQATELDTQLVMRSIGSTHRVWANEAAARCLELEGKSAELNEILQVVAGAKSKIMYTTGDLTAGIIACGQGVGQIKEIPTMKELFDRIMAQAGEIAGRMGRGDMG